MSKVKKMRAYQMAEQLSMPFKDFRQHAQQQGHKLYSAQESYPIEEARALIASVQRAVALATQPSADIAISTKAVMDASAETTDVSAETTVDMADGMTETDKAIEGAEAATRPLVELSEASLVIERLAVAETMSGAYTAWAQIAQLTSDGTESAKDSGTNPAFFLAEMIETGGDSGAVAQWPSESMDVPVLQEESAASMVRVERIQQTTLLRAVTFQVEHALTRPGDRLFVVGDRPEMGTWDPARGVELDPSAWPMWKASILLPEGTHFSYKIVQKTPKGWVWELGANRSGSCEGDASGILESVFRA